MLQELLSVKHKYVRFVLLEVVGRGELALPVEADRIDSVLEKFAAYHTFE